jgi:hypothetical protein
VKKKLREMLTPEIASAVSERLLHGGNLASSNLSKTEVKIALLVVLDLNPWETLSAGEAAVVYGLTEPTLRKREIKAGAMPNQINLGK